MMSFSNHTIAYNYSGEITDTEHKPYLYLCNQVGDSFVWLLLFLW